MAGLAIHIGRAAACLRFAALLLSGALCVPAAAADDSPWTDREVRILSTLRLDPALAAPPSPSNRVADDPRAAELGRLLFYDSRASANGAISCASCHQPARYFTDNLARAKGTGETARNAPTVVGAAHLAWFYWDGRRDSLWSQALTPFEADAEMGASRLGVIRLVGRDGDYRSRYEAIFGAFPLELLADDLPDHAGPLGDEAKREAWQRLPLPTRRLINVAYANVGKSIAAYERTLQPPQTRFDRYVTALLEHRVTAADALSEDEIAGARLFIDSNRSQCLQCHNGAFLTNGGFHNVGTGTFSGPRLDFGRVFGLRAVLMDEFNCLGPYSDALPEQCLELRFLNRHAHVPLEGAFKVPSLRNLKHTYPYMHDGRFATLAEVLAFYRRPPESVSPHELKPLDASDRELSQLEAFLLSLSAD